MSYIYNVGQSLNVVYLTIVKHPSFRAPLSLIDVESTKLKDDRHKNYDIKTVTLKLEK